MQYQIHLIGIVTKTDTEISLDIRKEYRDALVHLDLFSHAIVLWWIDGMDTKESRKTTMANPPKNKGPQPSGVFSCRSPARPNPIGHTIVQVLSVDYKEGRILVDHMDANDGSPIIDIKPYLPSSDKVDNARVAPWFEALQPRYTE